MLITAKQRDAEIMKIIIFTLCIFCTAFISCSVTESENQPVYAPDNKTPVTGGIILTCQTDPTEIGVWGNPVNPEEWRLHGQTRPNHASGIPWRVWLSSPYPNPTNVQSNIQFSLPYATNVRLYIVPARLSGTPDKSNSFVTGGLFAAPQGIAIKVLVDGSLNAGNYTNRWDATDSRNNKVPAGFYRVYMEAGDNLLWRDIWIYRQKEDLPAELRGR